MSRGRVVVAMSGGVDSSVTAALLKDAGYEVIGVTMRLWTQENADLPRFQRSCCSVETIDDARRVCQILNIPYYVLNFEREFRTYVVDYFCRDYQRGRTPNPCLACNRWLKFRFLMQRVVALGADYLATGHYAQIEESDARYSLFRAVDRSKDQSYVLYTLTQKELSRLLLPIGQYRKTEVRRLATNFGLPVADKSDSQEICFVPDNDYRGFLKRYLETVAGEIVDEEGTLLGRHEGIAFYTIGQRHGLGLATGERLYVAGIEAEHNRLIVGPESRIFRHSLLAEEVNFISGDRPEGSLSITAKIRYKSHDAPATLICNGDTAEVRFREPQRAITPGQAVVFYQGDEVIGGGIIAS